MSLTQAENWNFCWVHDLILESLQSARETRAGGRRRATERGARRIRVPPRRTKDTRGESGGPPARACVHGRVYTSDDAH
eukprot:1599480-Prymnesium_polylepis.1